MRSNYSNQLVILAGVIVAFTVSGSAQTSNAAHPLDPLSRDEIAATVKILKAGGNVTNASRFVTLVLHEPPKQEVLNWKPGMPFRRESFAVVYERESNTTHEAVVDLVKQQIVSWKLIPRMQPPFLIEDFLLTQTIVHTDPQWQAAMLKRGIKDFAKVQVDAWSAGYYGLPGEDGVRMVRALSYWRGDMKNPYSHPIEGVVAYVDLTHRKVAKLVDTGVVPVPGGNQDLDEQSVGEQREAPKPLELVQKNGPGFEVKDDRVRWQNWDFRFAMHPREGLVLYTVGYNDRGKLRPVMYRASLSEMVVPYGDPGQSWFFKNAFDEGEYGIGRLAQPLQPLVDVPNNAVFYDALFAGDFGIALPIKRAVAIYERDGGILWKHVDYLTNHSESRRARELVIMWLASVGNYEYAFNWVFHQDGTIEMELDLTGIMQAKGFDPNRKEPSKYAHKVGRGVEAVYHQHFFNFRLDMDVDGSRGNSVVEFNTVPLPRGPANPHNNAFTTTSTVLHNELQAQRDVNMDTSRTWAVINNSARNGLGQPTGYMLLPEHNTPPYQSVLSSVRKRAGFVSHHLWVTRYAPDENEAAGYYINQSKGGEGLPKWTRANRSIDNQDVVLWYTMGITHIPRPEEWPVMPVHKIGFKLVPRDFFDRNPALDVPVAPN